MRRRYQSRWGAIQRRGKPRAARLGSYGSYGGLAEDLAGNGNGGLTPEEKGYGLEEIPGIDLVVGGDDVWQDDDDAWEDDDDGILDWWDDDDGDGFVAPGAVPVRPANWNLEAKPYATYKIAMDDTFVGLSATYLGDGARWKEIYNTGKNKQLIPNPDSIKTQGPIDMPDEARDKMIAWQKKGSPPGEKPGDIPDDEVKKIKDRPKYIAAGAIALVAVATIGGVLIYRAS